MQALAPRTEAKVPVGQATQVLRTAEAETRPAAHAMHAAELALRDAPEYSPAGQSTQAAAPTIFENCPAAQGSHAEAPPAA